MKLAGSVVEPNITFGPTDPPTAISPSTEKKWADRLRPLVPPIWTLICTYRRRCKMTFNFS